MGQKKKKRIVRARLRVSLVRRITSEKRYVNTTLEMGMMMRLANILYEATTSLPSTFTFEFFTA
jgi:hypothetical protein